MSKRHSETALLSHDYLQHYTGEADLERESEAGRWKESWSEGAA